MNKSAEQIKEKYFKERYPRFGPIMSKADYNAGYNARDEEVKKLVEVLSKIMTIYDVMIDAAGYTEEAYPQMFSVRDKAKEALKPYQK